MPDRRILAQQADEPDPARVIESAAAAATGTSRAKLRARLGNPVMGLFPFTKSIQAPDTAAMPLQALASKHSDPECCLKWDQLAERASSALMNRLDGWTCINPPVRSFHGSPGREGGGCVSFFACASFYAMATASALCPVYSPSNVEPF